MLISHLSPVDDNYTKIVPANIIRFLYWLYSRLYSNIISQYNLAESLQTKPNLPTLTRFGCNHADRLRLIHRLLHGVHVALHDRFENAVVGGIL